LTQHGSRSDPIRSDPIRSDPRKPIRAEARRGEHATVPEPAEQPGVSPVHIAGMVEENPIRWTRDLAASAWIGARLDHSSGRITALVPAGYEAYARIIHPPVTFPPHQLPAHQLQVLVDILRGETTTPDLCWFCVDDRSRSLDDQGVTERVRLPRGSASYLMHGGPIERALVSPPGQSLQVALPEGAPPPDLLAAMREQLEGKPDTIVCFPIDTTRAQLEQWLADLQGRAPDLWWPEDRAWLVRIPEYLDLDSTFVAGSRRLIERLLAVPGLEVVEAQGTDRLRDVEHDEQERTYGPVIASGTDAGRPWSLRGRIGARGTSTWLQTSTGGGARAEGRFLSRTWAGRSWATSVASARARATR
jgi:hypothetical protein